MTHAETSIHKAAADADNLDIRLMVGTVVPDLLQAAKRREVPDAVGEDDLPLQRHTGRDRGHVLLRDPRVRELVRTLLPERFQDTKSEVPGDELNISILFRQFNQRSHKGVSHTSCTFSSLPERASTRRIFSG